MDRIINAFNTLNEINDNYKIDTGSIARYLNSIKSEHVCVPIIGKFSSGKSALYNTMLNYTYKLLKEDITPETAIPTELVYTKPRRCLSMDKVCCDKAFGEMIYKHRWYKKQNINAFGREWNIVVAAKAYSGKEITSEQQKAYSAFMDNEEKLLGIVEEQLKEYINSNLHSLAEYWLGARKINTVNELAAVVSPKTLLIQQDGTTIMLLDCVWDEEAGVAVELMPKIAVGSQDLFL